jgi:hypothetical protein
LAIPGKTDSVKNAALLHPDVILLTAKPQATVPKNDTFGVKLVFVGTTKFL